MHRLKYLEIVNPTRNIVNQKAKRNHASERPQIISLLRLKSVGFLGQRDLSESVAAENVPPLTYFCGCIIQMTVHTSKSRRY